MSIIKITKDELNKYEPIRPIGWYTFVVSNMVEKPKDNSINFVTTLKILSPSNGGKEFDKYFNSKGGFVLAPFIAACEGVAPEELFGENEDTEIDPLKTVGKQFDGLLYHREYEGKFYNDIQNDGFAPAGTMVKGALDSDDVDA